MSFRDLLQSGATKTKLSSWENSVKQIQRHRPAGTLRMRDNIEKLRPAKPSSSKVFSLSSSWVVRIRGGTRVLLINNNRAAWQVESRAGLRNLLCSVGNFDTMGSAGGQHNVQYTEWRMDKYVQIYLRILLYIMFNKNTSYIHINRNCYKNVIRNLGWVSLFVAHFYKMS